jgi:hypothetical protein
MASLPDSTSLSRPSAGYGQHYLVPGGPATLIGTLPLLDVVGGSVRATPASDPQYRPFNQSYQQQRIWAESLWGDRAGYALFRDLARTPARPGLPLVA